MNNIIPVVLLKDLIILPNQEIKIELNNKISKLIIKKAMDDFDSHVLVVSPIDSKEEEPSIDDLPKVGVIAKIKSKLQLPTGNIRVTLRGIDRVIITRYFASNWNENILHCEYQQIELPKFASSEENALKRKLLTTLKEYINSSDNISNSVLSTVNKAKNISSITDIITSFLPFNPEKKSSYMQNYNPLNRAIDLLNDLKEEMEIIKLDEKLDEQVREILDENQKEFILKEKIKAIKLELGEKNSQELDKEHFLEQLNKLKIDSDIKNKILIEIEKYALLNEISPELGMQRSYLDWILSLPWNKLTKDPTDYQTVLNQLNESHYGLDVIKERISDYIAVKSLHKQIKSPIICLIGPPGVGKTSIAMAIASVLKRKFYKISVGGLNDSTELIGSRRTYLGANPGKIIQALRKCGSKNPVILIDEVDKMTKNYHGDPASTLLEIIDPIQNKFFTDNYIEEPFDLHDVLFILTANYEENIPETILDRVEVINVNSYTIFEKKDIAQKYLLPKICREYNCDNLKLSDKVIFKIILNYTKEAGVRELERTIEKLIRKAIINKQNKISEKDIITYLGKPKYLNNYLVPTKIGEVNTLGVNGYGGFCSKMEVSLTTGDGKIYITGSVGNVLEESVMVAISYLKANYKFDFKNKNLHLHFLDATSKKNGPSAGLSIAVGLMSIAKNIKVPKNVAFTGEISLTGEILEIGGLKEKLIAAYNNGVNVVFIPKANIPSLEEVPKVIKDKLEIYPINDFKEVYTKIFK